jgi:hypothetical protein
MHHLASERDTYSVLTQNTGGSFSLKWAWIVRGTGSFLSLHDWTVSELRNEHNIKKRSWRLHLRQKDQEVNKFCYSAICEIFNKNIFKLFFKNFSENDVVLCWNDRSYLIIEQTCSWAVRFPTTIFLVARETIHCSLGGGGRTPFSRRVPTYICQYCLEPFETEARE